MARGELEVCQICNKVYRQVNHSHLKKHGLTPKQYEEAYNRVFVHATHLPSSQSSTLTVEQLQMSSRDMTYLKHREEEMLKVLRDINPEMRDWEDEQVLELVGYR